MSEGEATSGVQGPRSVRLTQLGTSLGRARCAQASQLARMRQSLSVHGQLTPLIAVERASQLQIVDGFKRRAAAEQMAWSELMVSVRSLDERAQWAAMLALNRTPGALSVLEEALIVRELCQVGLSQAEIGQLVGRHKSWVSRRLGLVERLHADLLGWVRTGLMAAGTARRLIVLPAGNQLEMAAVISKHSLSTEETELLVSLWRKAGDPQIRRFLLAEPRTALERARPEKTQAPPDVRLSARGQVLAKALPILCAVAHRICDALSPPPEPLDLQLLKAQLLRTEQALPGLVQALGSAARCAPSAASSARSATPTSDGSSPTEAASRAPPEKPAST
jgi:ParB/RepB/Spo0J family partition protein